jgi:hypothetical protein
MCYEPGDPTQGFSIKLLFAARRNGSFKLVFECGSSTLLIHTEPILQRAVHWPADLGEITAYLSAPAIFPRVDFMKALPSWRYRRG